MPKLFKRWNLRGDRKKKSKIALSLEAKKDMLLCDSTHLSGKPKTGIGKWLRRRFQKKEKAFSSQNSGSIIERSEKTKKEKRFKLLRAFRHSKEKNRIKRRSQIADSNSLDHSLAGSYNNSGFTDSKKATIENRVKDAQESSTDNAQCIANIQQDVRNIEGDLKDVKQDLKQILQYLRLNRTSYYGDIGQSVEQSPSLNWSTDTAMMGSAPESNTSQSDLDVEVHQSFLTNWSNGGARYSGLSLPPCGHQNACGCQLMLPVDK